MSAELFREIYRRMYRVRRFDEVVAELAAAGEIPGAVHLSIGQEAAVVGACLAVREDDYMVGTHRSHGHPIAKGAAIAPLMAELLGRSTGINKGKGGSMHLADFKVGSLGETSIVGSGLPVATGGALSAKMRGTDQVSLCFFGDGAACEGAFHESVNLAAVWTLPAIFFCENNQYALSTPVASTVSIPNIGDRGAAYGIPGVVIDGQDPIAAWEAVTAAATRARAGEGPSLIEAKTYRFTEHSVGLRISYRTDEEVESWKQRDPIPAFRARIIAEGVNSEAEVAAAEAEISSEVDAAVEFARQSPYPSYEDAFEDVYADPLPAMEGSWR